MKAEYRISFFVLALLICILCGCISVHATELPEEEIQVEEIVEENTENVQDLLITEPEVFEIVEEQIDEEDNIVEETITNTENEQLTEIINILNVQAEINAENELIHHENEARIIELLDCIMFLIAFIFSYFVIKSFFAKVRKQSK